MIQKNVQVILHIFVTLYGMMVVLLQGKYLGAKSAGNVKYYMLVLTITLLL